jgi:hypothetical protein
MEKPYKYAVKDNRSGEFTEKNYISGYELYNMNFVVWIDTRYEAKLRLFRYWQKKNGIIEKRYNPFEGTEIGKSIPILNF